jgi:hypothetical protein
MNVRRFALAFAVPAVLAGGIGVGVGCSDSETAVDPVPVLEALTTNVILPEYAAFDAGSMELAQSADAFAKGPDATTLNALRASWRKARLAYRTLDAVRFGPAEDIALSTAIDDHATNAEAIESFLSGADAVDTTLFSKLGSNKVGFFAIEYLIFVPTNDPATAGTAPNPPKSDAEVLAKFTGDAGVRRRTFVAVLAAKVAELAKSVNETWKTSYADALRKPGNALFPSAKSGMDRILGNLVNGLETVVKQDLGTPVGQYTAGKVQPSSVRTVRSDNAIAEIRASLAGSSSIYFGAKGSVGFAQLVQARNKTVDGRVATAAAAVTTACEPLASPFAESLERDNAKVRAAYEAVNAEKRVLATDVASVLGITIALNPNDGD